MNKFKIHGKCDLSVVNDILTIDIEGPCNREFYDHMHTKLLNIAPQLNLQNYAVMIILRGEVSIINEALGFHVEFLKARTVKAIAVVLKWCATPSMTKAMCHKAYEEAGIIQQFFENIDNAKNWLRDDVLDILNGQITNIF